MLQVKRVKLQALLDVYSYAEKAEGVSSIVLESSIVYFRTRGGKFRVDPVAKSILRSSRCPQTVLICISKSLQSVQILILILILIFYNEQYLESEKTVCTMRQTPYYNS